MLNRDWLRLFPSICGFVWISGGKNHSQSIASYVIVRFFHKRHKVSAFVYFYKLNVCFDRDPLRD